NLETIRTFPAWRRMLRHAVRFLLGCLAVNLALAADTGSGTIIGNVSNAASGNLLEGARVEIPVLHLTTFADRSGRYTLDGVPVGTHEITASYTGLDSARLPVTVSAGQTTSR